MSGKKYYKHGWPAVWAVEKRDAAIAKYIREARDWQVFGTLTFEDLIPAAVAFKRFNGFMRWVARNTVREHFDVAFAWNRQRRDVLHFHFVAATLGDRKLKPEDFYLHWKGNSKVEEYNPDRLGPKYLADHRNWSQQVACPWTNPCKRAGRCLKAPGPWSLEADM